MTPTQRPRLYLTSYLLGEDAELLRWGGNSPGRAAIVMNALDVFGSTRLRNWERESAAIEALGYETSELDLRDYVDDRAALAELMANVDLLWVVGGNAFWLAKVMHASGFADAIADPLEDGWLTYAGYSAGACVAGPDLAGIDLMDEPHRQPAGVDVAWEPTTMGLVDVRIVPHWESAHTEAADAERARAWLADAGLSHHCLRDGETLVVA